MDILGRGERTVVLTEWLTADGGGVFGREERTEGPGSRGTPDETEGGDWRMWSGGIGMGNGRGDCV